MSLDSEAQGAEEVLKEQRLKMLKVAMTLLLKDQRNNMISNEISHSRFRKSWSGV